MLERDHRDEDVAMAFPPAWCSRACKNSLSDKCIEWCAIKRDGSWCDPRPDVAIMDLPRFPLREFIEEMTPKERTLAIGLYTALMVDQAQGREVDDTRRNRRHPGNGHFLAVDQDQDLSTLVAAPPRPHEAGEECENSPKETGSTAGEPGSPS
jgi:hypothetical protein